jgi:hypothetical protein
VPQSKDRTDRQQPQAARPQNQAVQSGAKVTIIRAPATAARQVAWDRLWQRLLRPESSV